MSKEALQSQILQVLDRQGSISDTKGWLLEDGITAVDQLVLLGALNSLADRQMVSYTSLDSEVWVLSEEGATIAEHGSHEARVFACVPAGENGCTPAEVVQAVRDAEVVKIGQGKAFKNKWIRKDPKSGNLVRIVESIDDAAQKDLQQILTTGMHLSEDVLKDLRRRKLCDKQKITTYAVVKGPEFALVVEQQATEITAEMLVTGAWRTAKFKKYNFDAVGIAPSGGALHPLMKVREEFRQIFLEMGFAEMPTARFVESSFWNFDALFQPQQHPARDMHDTFFLKDPATTSDLPADLVDRVASMHTNGGDGSIGYGYDWKRSESETLLLRTHTTAVSSRMLHALAQQTEFKPVKYFSIDRVFRNEAVDATHLAEFHQVEGVIADRNLTLGDLIGFMDVFFRKMGVSNIRFKPAYNPYTEPSMEIFSYHSGLGRWVEVGNSGMFRPEMLGPLGLPSDVRVIAWGLSLERPTMIKYGISNIRELLGHKVDSGMISRNPVCRLDVEARYQYEGSVQVETDA